MKNLKVLEYLFWTYITFVVYWVIVTTIQRFSCPDLTSTQLTLQTFEALSLNFDCVQTSPDWWGITFGVFFLLTFIGLSIINRLSRR